MNTLNAIAESSGDYSTDYKDSVTLLRVAFFKRLTVLLFILIAYSVFPKVDSIGWLIKAFQGIAVERGRRASLIARLRSTGITAPLLQ